MRHTEYIDEDEQYEYDDEFDWSTGGIEAQPKVSDSELDER